MADEGAAIAACKQAIFQIFPDICPDFLDRTVREKDYNQEVIISTILDQVESGSSYPKRPRRALKRKRVEESDDVGDDEGDDEENYAEIMSQFGTSEGCAKSKDRAYYKTCKAILQQSYPRLTGKEMVTRLDENGRTLFPTYLALDALTDNEDPQHPPTISKDRWTPVRPTYDPDHLDEAINEAQDEGEKAALEEFRAAKDIQDLRKAKRQAKEADKLNEESNFTMSQMYGAVASCGCCFDEFAMNRMVHCSADKFHWFCKGCARRMAETQIGLSKYDLSCMSVDDCTAGFSRDQRTLFLDQKAVIALERIEQEAVLRMAGIENLETCPFCPYAAEYPPVVVDKEFRCENPECEVVSCRLCRKETHIPHTCEEAARQSGVSGRRKIEEAMSAALIRTCNKCSTPFIKEHGCNKMMCTRNGCRNVQCYVCHKSCDYTHFDDSGRGGKKGNCPLFDNVEKRHDEEVRVAQEAARKQVTEENPGLDEAALLIQVSERVKQDDEARMAGNLRPNANPRRGRYNRHEVAPVPGVVAEAIPVFFPRQVHQPIIYDNHVELPDNEQTVVDEMRRRIRDRREQRELVEEMRRRRPPGPPRQEGVGIAAQANQGHPDEVFWNQGHILDQPDGRYDPFQFERLPGPRYQPPADGSFAMRDGSAHPEQVAPLVQENRFPFILPVHPLPPLPPLPYFQNNPAPVNDNAQRPPGARWDNVPAPESSGLGFLP